MRTCEGDAAQPGHPTPPCRTTSRLGSRAVRCRSRASLLTMRVRSGGPDELGHALSGDAEERPDAVHGQPFGVERLGLGSLETTCCLDQVVQALACAFDDERWRFFGHDHRVRIALRPPAADQGRGRAIIVRCWQIPSRTSSNWSIPSSTGSSPWRRPFMPSIPGTLAPPVRWLAVPAAARGIAAMGIAVRGLAAMPLACHAVVGASGRRRARKGGRVGVRGRPGHGRIRARAGQDRDLRSAADLGSERLAHLHGDERCRGGESGDCGGGFGDEFADRDGVAGGAESAVCLLLGCSRASS